MKKMSFRFMLLLIMPCVAMSQGLNQTNQNPAGMSVNIHDELGWIGFPSNKIDLAYQALKKSCKVIHDVPHQPSNAYSVKVGDCYIIWGTVAQQVSKTQALMQRVNKDDGDYFVGYFSNDSEFVDDGEIHQLGYSPAEGDEIIGVGVGEKPFTYEATDGTTMTVPAYTLIFYGHPHL